MIWTDTDIAYHAKSDAEKMTDSLGSCGCGIGEGGGLLPNGPRLSITYHKNVFGSLSGKRD